MASVLCLALLRLFGDDDVDEDSLRIELEITSLILFGASKFLPLPEELVPAVATATAAADVTLFIPAGDPGIPLVEVPPPPPPPLELVDSFWVNGTWRRWWRLLELVAELDGAAGWKIGQWWWPNAWWLLRSPLWWLPAWTISPPPFPSPPPDRHFQFAVLFRFSLPEFSSHMSQLYVDESVSVLTWWPKTSWLLGWKWDSSPPVNHQTHPFHVKISAKTLSEHFVNWSYWPPYMHTLHGLIYREKSVTSLFSLHPQVEVSLPTDCKEAFYTSCSFGGNVSSLWANNVGQLMKRERRRRNTYV